MSSVSLRITLYLLLLAQSCKKNNSPPESTFKQVLQPSNQDGFKSLLQEYEDPDRQDWQNPDLVLERIGKLDGKTVADIGAGSGYFTFRLAEQAEKVIAIEIDERFIEYISEKKSNFPAEIGGKVEIRLTDPENPSLDTKEADIVLMVNTYRFLRDRPEYLKKIKTSMTEEGMLMIVDIKGTEVPVGHSKDLFVSPEQIENELQSTGFKTEYTDSTSLPYQFIIKAIQDVD